MKQSNPAAALSAWEGARRLQDAVKALFAVCGAVLFQPVFFFQSVLRSQTDTRRRIVRACAFALALGYLKLLCDGLNILGLKQVASSGIMMDGLSSQIAALESAFFSSPVILARPVVTLAATLALVAAGVKLILGVDRILVPAVLVVCYKSAADLFNVIPFLGGVLASAWSLALLVMGIREMYGVGVGRSVLAGVMTPLLVLLFFALSLGPSLNRAIVTFFPETQAQMMKFNDVTAYGYTSAVARAAKDYKDDLGFYPANLDVLKKYLAAPVVDNLGSSENASGYRFSYSKSDEEHFVVKAAPLSPGVTGSLVFYADDSGKVRLGGKDGRVLVDLQSLEEVVAQPARPAEGKT